MACQCRMLVTQTKRVEPKMVELAPRPITKSPSAKDTLRLDQTLASPHEVYDTQENHSN